MKKYSKYSFILNINKQIYKLKTKKALFFNNLNYFQELFFYDIN